MNCPACSRTLKVRQVYRAGNNAKTARVECEKCQRVYTQVAFLVGEAQARGQGAYALAKKIEKRDEPLNLDMD